MKKDEYARWDNYGYYCTISGAYCYYEDCRKCDLAKCLEAEHAIEILYDKELQEQNEKLAEQPRRPRREGI